MFKSKTKFYTQVPCKACGGTGKMEQLKVTKSSGMDNEMALKLLMAAQGVCLGCEGKGTQTVLEYEDK